MIETREAHDRQVRDSRIGAACFDSKRAYITLRKHEFWVSCKNKSCN